MCVNYAVFPSHTSSLRLKCNKCLFFLINIYAQWVTVKNGKVLSAIHSSLSVITVATAEFQQMLSFLVNSFAT
jgi:hypothetical protein